MVGSRIRLRSTGFIIFLTRLISIGTGLIFTLMVTRSISPEDYGVYGNLGDILSYFTIISSVIPFWVVRFELRRFLGSFKTGLVMNSLIGLASAILYLSSVTIIMSSLGISLSYMPVYLIATFLILESHILSIFEASLYSKCPEKIGLGMLIFEGSKVALGVLCLFFLKMGLIGALIAIILAYLCQIAFYLKLLLREFRESIVWAYAKEWIKASALNVYGIIGERLLILANIFLFIYGGELSRAYYGASYAIASIVAYSSSLAFALYPKLLSEARSEDITLSLKLVLMFAIPMFFGALVLSRELLLILNPVYSAAAPTLTVIALSSLILSASSVFESIIAGTENFDATAKISFRSAFRSKLFQLLTLRYVQASIVLPSTYIVLTALQLDSVSSTFYFALTGFAGHFIVMLIKLHLARGNIAFTIPFRSLVKYACSALLMALGLYALHMPPRLTMILLKTFIGAMIYFATLTIIDAETRETAKLILKTVMRYFS